MFDIAQWGLGMDETGPVKFIPPADPKAVRGLQMIYANGVVMKHEEFGRGIGRPFDWDPAKEKFKDDKEANALLLPGIPQWMEIKLVYRFSYI